MLLISTFYNAFKRKNLSGHSCTPRPLMYIGYMLEYVAPNFSNNNNIPNVTPQVKSVENKMYKDRTLPLLGREVVFKRP